MPSADETRAESNCASRHHRWSTCGMMPSGCSTDERPDRADLAEQPDGGHLHLARPGPGAEGSPLAPCAAASCAAGVGKLVERRPRTAESEYCLRSARISASR